MSDFTLDQHSTFIVRAKAAAYVGQGPKSLSYRPGSHDLQFHDGDFSYLDSYFGGTDFIGQEVVYFRGKPVWAMNYYGRILEPALILSMALVTGFIVISLLMAIFSITDIPF